MGIFARGLELGDRHQQVGGKIRVLSRQFTCGYALAMRKSFGCFRESIVEIHYALSSVPQAT